VGRLGLRRQDPAEDRGADPSEPLAGACRAGEEAIGPAHQVRAVDAVWCVLELPMNCFKRVGWETTQKAGNLGVDSMVEAFVWCGLRREARGEETTEFRVTVGYVFHGSGVRRCGSTSGGLGSEPKHKPRDFSSRRDLEQHKARSRDLHRTATKLTGQPVSSAWSMSIDVPACAFQTRPFPGPHSLPLDVVSSQKVPNQAGPCAALIPHNLNFGNFWATATVGCQHAPRLCVALAQQRNRALLRAVTL